MKTKPKQKQLNEIMSEHPEHCTPYWDEANLVGAIAEIAARDARDIIRAPRDPVYRGINVLDELEGLMEVVYHAPGFTATIYDRLSHETYLGLLLYCLYHDRQRITSKLRLRFIELLDSTCDQEPVIDYARRSKPEQENEDWDEHFIPEPQKWDDDTERNNAFKRNPTGDPRRVAKLVRWICNDFDPGELKNTLGIVGDWGGVERKLIMKTLNEGQELEETESVNEEITVESPITWQKLHDDFSEAIEKVINCTSNNERNFILSCVNVTPDWVEALDNRQMARYTLKTGIRERVLIQNYDLKQIIDFDATHVFQTANWIHFKNSSDAILKCRQYKDEICDIGKYLHKKGTPVTLPVGLKEAVEKAHVFTAEMLDDSRILIELSNGRLKVKGLGPSGEFEETFEIEYNGDSIASLVPPLTLAEVAEKNKECEFTATQLRVTSENFIYAAALGTIIESID